MNDKRVFVKICKHCGAVYLPQYAARPAWVCGCGYGGGIVTAAEARKYVVEQQEIQRRNNP